MPFFGHSCLVCKVAAQLPNIISKMHSYHHRRNNIREFEQTIFVNSNTKRQMDMILFRVEKQQLPQFVFSVTVSGAKCRVFLYFVRIEKLECFELKQAKFCEHNLMQFSLAKLFLFFSNSRTICEIHDSSFSFVKYKPHYHSTIENDK